MSETGGSVDSGGIEAAQDPFELFAEWMAAAEKSEPNDPNAMAVATVDADGRPNLRMVLLKGVDDRGFVFYTNTESAKGRELAGNPHVALNFHWKTQRRQVRVRGPATPVDPKEADAYFASRAKDSQIGAWASAQSRPMIGRWVFEKEIAKFAMKFALTKVPRPPHWSGYRVAPLEIEFWRDRPFRLHDRLVYRRNALDEPWRTERLFP
ncbi:MAG: pyridoxamine 5'-phosphate oxidase [Alphaproteobacteria bacterium]|nr:pyridoxamine 5'-phosphate oxidase [Alphaproteobacteria bacterium]MDE2111172.1 pyridoxamine 5'-phosphate oxidase [Alphaproteobacteria bacterium]MDE2495990.1 pyridoxamine 5'-phosphate oxidase [Alphaproteobacteria bacterium]